MPPATALPLLEEFMHGEDGYYRSLNAFQGDVEVTFKEKRPEDVARAQELIEQAMKQGFPIMVKDKLGRVRTVTKFDPKRGRYIIGDRKAPEGEVPMEEAQAVATPRGAGG